MPALRDLPVVIRHVGLVKFLKKVWFEIGDDNLFTWASALAYSWLFAVFPFFLTLLSLIPLLKYEWRVEAKEQIQLAINQLPHEAKVTVAQYVMPRMDELLFSHERKSITSILSLGLLVTLWAASGGMNMTMAAMDRAYDVPRARPIYKQRPLAILLTTIVAGLILAVIILIPVGTVVTNYLMTRTDKLLTETGISRPLTATTAATSNATTTATTTPATQPVVMQTDQPHQFVLFIALWQIFRFGLALMFLFWVVALVFHYGPNVKQRFRLLSPGSVFTVGAWALLAAVFRFYVDTFGKYGQTYGAVGGVIILLFFFYLDALLLLMGAELNSEVDAGMRAIAHQRAKPPPPMETKDTVKTPETP